MLSAAWTRNVLFLDVICHLLVCPACNVSAVKILDEIVGSVSCLTLLAVHKRIGETAEVTRCHPCLRVHKDSGIKTYVVLVLLNEFLSPRCFDVCFQLNAERTVVPCICKTAVDLAARINEASAFAKCDYFVHCLFGIVHFSFSLQYSDRFIEKHNVNSFILLSDRRR